MNVLVTGATGFVGSHVADRLLARGHSVRALIRSTSSLQWLADKGIETVSGNLQDHTTLREAVTGVDAIVHVAGVTASRDKQGYFNGNQVATRELLTAVKQYNPSLERFILASSLTAVGPSLDGQPVTELTPPHPITTYGKSKRAAEEECEQMRDHFSVTILRLAAVYGPRDTAVLTFFQTVNKRLKPLIGFRDKYVNLIHVQDCAQMVELALIKKEALNETYMVGSELHYSWREVSQLTAKILEKTGMTIRLPHAIVYGVAGFSEILTLFQKKPSVLNWEKGRDMVQTHWTCSVEKAKKELGYKEEMPLESGIRNTIEWYREHSWL